MDTDNPIEIAVGAVADLLIELHKNKVINLDKVNKGKIVNDTNDRLVLNRGDDMSDQRLQTEISVARHILQLSHLLIAELWRGYTSLSESESTRVGEQVQLVLDAMVEYRDRTEEIDRQTWRSSREW